MEIIQTAVKLETGTMPSGSLSALKWPQTLPTAR